MIWALCLASVLLSCLACGDVYNTAKLENINFAGTTQLLRNYTATYTVCSLVQCVGMLFLLTADTRYDSVNKLFSVRLARFLAVLLIVPLFFGARQYFYSHEGTFRDWRSQLQQLFQPPPPGRGNAFPGEVTIRSPQFDADTPVRVVMRAMASSAVPAAMRPSIPIEQGRITIASAAALPEQNGASNRRSSRPAGGSQPSSCRQISRAVSVRTTCTATPSSAAARSRNRRA